MGDQSGAEENATDAQTVEEQRKDGDDHQKAV